LIAAHACVRCEAIGSRAEGSVLVAPCCDVDWTPLLRAQAGMGSFLAKVMPDYRGAAAITPERLSSDARAIEEYTKDPSVKVASVRFLAAFEILRGFAELKELAPRFKTPVLVIHGTKDAACFLPASEAFVRAAGSADKTFVAIEDGSHLLLHDAATRRRVTRMVVDFVVSRSGERREPRIEWGEDAGENAARNGTRAASGAVTESTEKRVPEMDIGSRL